MIFNRLFKSAHQSKDPEKRLAAIEKLSKDVMAERQVLHELAFNDDSVDVSLAALNKLNSFALWQKMAQISKNDRVKRTASQQVESAILALENPSITKEEREAFLVENASTDLVIKVLQTDDSIAANTALSVALLRKVGRQNVLQNFFLNRATQDCQRAIVAETQDTDLLQKLFRKTANNETKSLVEQRLSVLVAIKEKPLEIEKSVTMLLSKLQALGDKTDYEVVASSQEKLEVEYAELRNEFGCVDSAIVDEMESKYTRIQARLARHISKLKEQFELLANERKIADVKTTLHKQLADLKSRFDNLFNDDFMSVTAGQVSDIQMLIEQALETIDTLSSIDGTAKIESHLSTLSSMRSQLDDLPKLQAKGNSVIAVLNSAQLLFEGYDKEAMRLETFEQSWAQCKRQWKEVIQNISPLPHKWSSEWKSYGNQFSKIVKADNQQKEKQLAVCRKHIGVVTSLVDQGRFRAAISRFKKLDTDFANLPEKLQSKLLKRFEETKNKIENLQGWQSYIAAPRRPLLLEEAQALAADASPSSISDRANKIKVLRSQWQSLGDSHSSEDASLNAAFDDALESAFSPCRAFYAQQEENKKRAVDERQALISQLCEFDKDISMDVLHSRVEKIKQAWRDSGHIDNKDYQALKKQWDDALSPITERLNAWYQSNRERKQALIDRVAALLDVDSKEATVQAQQAQQTWKEIGYAGRRYESKLWQAFRSENDKIFGRAKAQREAFNAERNKLVEEESGKLETAKQCVNDDNLETALQIVEEVAVGLSSLNKRDQAKLNKMSNQILLDIEQKKAVRKQLAFEAQIDTLVHVLSTWCKGDASASCSDAQWGALPRAWKQALASATSSSLDYSDRKELTVVLEALSDIPSPDEDSSLRTTVQLGLMTAKLEKGEYKNTKDLLINWLSLGPVTQEDKPLIARLENVLNTLGTSGAN